MVKGSVVMSEWDNRLRVLLYGHGKEPFKLLRDSLPGVLEDAGFEVVWRCPYSIVDEDDIEAVIKDEDLREKNSAWLRQVDTDELQELVDGIEAERPHVRGYGIAVESDRFKGLYHTLNAYPIPEHWKFTLATGRDPDAHRGEWQPEAVKNRNAPFSYDPADDYSTEPNR